MSRWLLFLIPAALFAASPFEGTWRIDASTVDLHMKPAKFDLMNGTFSCPDCLTPIPSVKADGTDQKLTGTNAYDTVSVKVIDARRVDLTFKKAGKTREVMRITAAEDGAHRTVRFTLYPENGSEPLDEEMTEALVEKGPAGSHAISGTWGSQKLASISGNATTTYKEIPGGLSMTSTSGASFTAKFDGKDYPIQGSPTVDTVSLKLIDDHTIDATLKHTGKVVEVQHIVIDAGGKTGTVTEENKSSGSTAKIGIVKI